MTKENGHLMFTDGSSLGNPGPGGWGTVILLQNKGRQRSVFELGGAEKHTTNNRMELRALIEGLRRVQDGTLRIDAHGSTLYAPTLTIYLDSSYVHKGATRWSHAWVKNDWQTKGKKDVENRDLWEMLLPLLEGQKKVGKIIWKHIPGHSGLAGNERADAIATGFARLSSQHGQAKDKDVELFEGNLEHYSVDILNTRVDERVAERRTTSRAHSRAKAYSYLSLIDGKAMRHATWADCEKRVKGRAGVRYKKALSPEDESVILKSWNASF